MIKIISMLFAFAAAEPHPFDYDMALLDGTFAQKLDFLCRINDIGDPGIVERLREMTPLFESNYETIMEVQNLAPTDRYLANLLHFIALSDMTASRKQERFRAGYERCLRETGWNLAINNILYWQPDILTKVELTQLLKSKETYIRRAAERILKTRYTRDSRRQSDVPPRNPAGKIHGNDRSPASSIFAEENSFWELKWGIAGGVLVLLAAIGWWLMIRLSQNK